MKTSGNTEISVIGSGYVGTTTSALLATAGYKVTAIDIDEKKVAEINAGKAPFYEGGLDSLIKNAVESGNLKASAEYDSVKTADVVFSSVGTPDNADGSPNLRYVIDVAERVSKIAQKEAIFVQKSTVPVGTGEKLSKILSNQVYISNPEFLREGTAIQDSVFYDRIVLGHTNMEAAKKVEELFLAIRESAAVVSKKSELGFDQELIDSHQGETIFTNINSAELIKVTANAFLALKISFANSVAKLSDKSGADVVEVMNGVGSDKRIGNAFFNAGRGYGGGCFPKDVSGLVSVAIEHGVDFNIMTAATELNSSMPGYIVNKAVEAIPLKDKKVAILGLAFKAGTSDARKSPAVEIANLLVGIGANVMAYDPQATEEAKEDLDTSVTVVDSAYSALAGAEAVFIATDWPEFKSIPVSEYRDRMSGKIVVDAMNCLEKDEVESSGLTYIGVGR